MAIHAFLLCVSIAAEPHTALAHTVYPTAHANDDSISGLGHLNQLRVTNGKANNTLHSCCAVHRSRGCHSVHDAVCVGGVDPLPLPAQGTAASPCHRREEQKTQPECGTMQTEPRWQGVLHLTGFYFCISCGSKVLNSCTQAPDPSLPTRPCHLLIQASCLRQLLNSDPS